MFLRFPYCCIVVTVNSNNNKVALTLHNSTSAYSCSGYINLRFNKLRGGFLNLRPSALTARAATCARVGLARSIQNGRDPSWPPWPQVVQVRRDGCHQRPGFSSCRTRFSRQGLLQPCALCKLLHQRGTVLHLHVRSAYASSNTLFLHARIAICST